MQINTESPSASSVSREPLTLENLVHTSTSSGHSAEKILEEGLAREHESIFNDRDVTSLKIADQIEYTPPTRSEDYYNKAAFFVAGVAMLYSWNALINCVNATQTYLFPNVHNLADQSTAIFDSVAFAACLVVLWVGALKKFWLYLGACVSIVAAFLWIAAAEWCDLASGQAVLDVSAALAGVGCSLTQVSGVAYAVSYGRIYAGWVSFGIGGATVLSLGIWSLLFMAVYPNENAEDTRSSLVVHLSVAMFFQLLAIVMLGYMFRSRIFKLWKEEAARMQSMGTEEDRKVVGWWEGFKNTWHWQLHLCISMGVGFTTFPNILPLGFHETVSQTNWSMGANQIGQFVGRLIPNLAVWIPYVMIPKTPLKILDWMHLIIWALAMAVMYCPTATILGDYWFHIILAVCLGITCTWYSTLCWIYLPEAYTRSVDKGRVSAIGTTLMTGAIALGLALDQLWKIGYKP